MPFVSCVFWCFPLSCLNPVLAVLYASGILSPLAISGDPDSALLPWFFFHLLIWTSFLFFSSFIGFGAHISWFFRLQAFWAYHLFSFLISFSMAPCVIPLGLGAVIF